VSGEEIATLRGHTDAVLSASFSPDGQTVLTASSDGTLRYWNAPDGTELGTPYTHEGGGPMVAAYSPDGTTLAVGDHHGEVQLLAADSGAQVALLGTHSGNVTALAYSPDGTNLISVSGGEVRLWDLPSLAQVGEALFEPAFTSLAVSGDGARLSAGGADGVVYTYETSGGEQISTYASSMPPVTALGYGVESWTLYIGSTDSQIISIDADTGAEVATFETTAAVVDLTMHPQTAMINAAMADGALRWWGTELVEEYGTDYSHQNPLTATAFSPNGEWMASADESGTIFVWSVETGEFSFTLDGATTMVNDVAFSPDGTMAAAAMADARILVWALDAPTAVALELGGFFTPANAVAFSPDSTLIAVAVDDGTVQIYNAQTGENLGQHYFHNAPVYDIVFSPDGTRLFSAGANGQVVAWGIP
jgi:WD40 repeat protein